METEHRLSMLPWRIVAVLSFVVMVAMMGWQLVRIVRGEDRASLVTTLAVVGAVGTLIGVLIWTWVIVENARRLLAPATSQAPPDPMAVVAAWIAPAIVAAGGIVAVAYLQRRLLLPGDDTSSALPLAVAGGVVVATLVVSLRPLAAISRSLRRLGGRALPTDRLIGVPIVLAIVGAASIAAMRAGDLFGEDFTGIAPAWALGVVMLLPAGVVAVAMWQGAESAEDTVRLAFDRRNGTARLGTRRRGVASRLLRAEAFPRLPRSDSKPIRLAPGADALRLSMFVALAALCLVAIVGALVMAMFWRESRSGLLLPEQQERAWNVLDNLQTLQWWLALGLLAVTSMWAFVSVLNARLATGRRRNPVLAAAAWPAAALAIWVIGDRIVDESAPVVVAGFVAQALVFAVPFALLERSAIAVHAHRSPLRLSYVLGVVLLVQNQGLFGLSTLDLESELGDFGRLAGSLAVSALLQLAASLSVTESSRLIADAAADLADDHNALVGRHEARQDRRRGSTALGETPISSSTSA